MPQQHQGSPPGSLQPRHADGPVAASSRSLPAHSRGRARSRVQVHATPAAPGQAGKAEASASPTYLAVSALTAAAADCLAVPGNTKTWLQVSIAAAVGTGVANRVLYKLALVPMGGEGLENAGSRPSCSPDCPCVAADYVFVLSLAQTFGYVLVRPATVCS